MKIAEACLSEFVSLKTGRISEHSTRAEVELSRVVALVGVGAPDYWPGETEDFSGRFKY